MSTLLACYKLMCWLENHDWHQLRSGLHKCRLSMSVGYNDMICTVCLVSVIAFQINRATYGLSLNAGVNHLTVLQVHMLKDASVMEKVCTVSFCFWLQFMFVSYCIISILFCLSLISIFLHSNILCHFNQHSYVVSKPLLLQLVGIQVTLSVMPRFFTGKFHWFHFSIIVVIWYSGTAGRVLKLVVDCCLVMYDMLNNVHCCDYALLLLFFLSD